MYKIWGAIALLLLFSSIAQAQIGARADGIVLNQLGHPVAGAQVRVCSSPSSGQMPCSTVANIYSDVNLTIPLANPITTDSNGNYYFYIQGGTYELEFFGTGVVTSQLPDQTITLPLTSSPTFINVIITGNLTVGGTLAAGATTVSSITDTSLTTNYCVGIGSAGLLSNGSPNGCVLAASLTTTSGSSDNVTITGMTSSGHCSLTATNSSAASNFATAYVSAKTTNQITVSHASVASMAFDVLCTPN